MSFVQPHPKVINHIVLSNCIANMAVNLILKFFISDDFVLETIGGDDQQQMAMDEKAHLDSKSYLDSEIGSIFPTGM